MRAALTVIFLTALGFLQLLHPTQTNPPAASPTQAAAVVAVADRTHAALSTAGTETSSPSSSAASYILPQTDVPPRNTTLTVHTTALAPRGQVLGTSTQTTYVTQDELAAQIEQATNALRSLIYQNDSAPNSLPASGGYTNDIALSNRIDNLSGSSNGPLTISDATFNNVSGLTASEIPDLSGSYLSTSGGSTGKLSVTDTGSSSVATLGAELTTDGSFTTDPSSSWTLGSGWSWDSTNHRAAHAAGTGAIVAIAINDGGTGYTAGDTITISGGSGDAIYTATVSSGKVTGLTQVSAGTAYSSSANTSTTGGTGSGLKVSVTRIADATTLSESITTTYGQDYFVSFTIAAYTGTYGAVHVSLGGPITYFADDNSNSGYYVANGTYQVALTGGSAITFTPTADFAGAITNVSVKSITPSSAVVKVNNIDGSDTLELRPGGTNLYNSFIGLRAGMSNTTGYSNTATGFDSLLYNTTGTYNNAYGMMSLFSNTTGYRNIAIGSYTLYDNTTGALNTAVGMQSLFANTTGTNNTGVGAFSLYQNTTGTSNSAFGYRSLYSSTVGYTNTAIGYETLYNNRSGYYNTAVGGLSLFSNTTGYQNTANGENSLYSNTTGTNNTVLGYQAGYNLTTGTSNVLIGAEPTTANANLTTGSNNIGVGYNFSFGSSTASNQLDIGNIIFGTGLTGTGSTIAGNIGIGTGNPYSRLQVTGSDAASSTSAFAVVSSASSTVFSVFDGGNAQLSGTLTQSSDQRLKTNIQSLDASSSLSLIDALDPVTFNWIDPNQDSGTQVGFIAQQVQAIFPELVSTTSATTLTPGGTLGLNYIDLIAPAVSAIQALSSEVQNLIAEVQGFAQSFVSDNITVNNTLCIKDSAGTPVCVNGDQLAALLAGSSAPSSSSESSTPASTTPPTITINGDNLAIITIGGNYADLGATVSDTGHGQAGDPNLGLKYFLNGALVSNIVLDTSAVATDTVDYVATDSWGNAATSTRTVIVEAAPSTDATTSAATSTSQ
jgi:hypothetical protein